MSTNAHSYHELKWQDGKTSLHHAAIYGHTECLSLLVAHGSVTDLPSMKDKVSMAIVSFVYHSSKVLWHMFVNNCVQNSIKIIIIMHNNNSKNNSYNYNNYNNNENLDNIGNV